MSEEQSQPGAQSPGAPTSPDPIPPKAGQAEPPPDTAWVSFDSITGSGAPHD